MQQRNFLYRRRRRESPGSAAKAGKLPTDWRCTISSTNRGSQRSEADQYLTPPWCVTSLLEGSRDSLNLLQYAGARWVEPAAGEGNIVRAVNQFFEKNGCRLPQWTMVELRPECENPLGKLLLPGDEVVIRDFPEEYVSNDRFTVAITNPPFRLARDFIEKARRMADVVIMLLRLNFLGSSWRNQFMRANTPDVYVLPDRPSFRGDGQCDSIEYGWFVFSGCYSKSVGELRVLPCTPAEVRKRIR
jgi:hypothetical protein